jgi:AraC-like DNA-binding protein/quercetin dioxygenase-like cupin family protein
MLGHEIARYNFSEHDIEHAGFKLYQLKTNNTPMLRIDYFPEKTSIPHAHNFYEVCIFFEGSGTHEIDFTPYPIHNNTLHIITPGSVHLIKACPGTKGYIIAFSAAFYDYFAQQQQKLSSFSFYNLASSYPILNLESPSAEYVKNWLTNLITDYNNQSPNLFLWAHLHLFLWKIHLIYNELNPTSLLKIDANTKLLERFKHLVEQHFLEKHQVKEYAQLLFISPSQLNRIVKKITGSTAIGLIQDRILLEAKRLLFFSEMTNQEVAFHLAFVDPSHFTKLFKNKTGMTPSEFRLHAKRVHT